MAKQQDRTVQRFFEKGADQLALQLTNEDANLRRTIGEPTVNRPGLMLAGFRPHFAWRRIQVFGTAETRFLKSKPTQEQRLQLSALFDARIPCLVVCRGYHPSAEALEAAAAKKVPILRTTKVTKDFINDATHVLEDMFAPEDHLQGSMVDILGIGVVIQGDPGIGKSECVLALLERGYSVVSDDIVLVRRSEEKKLIGESPEITREFIEVRGIGIINVPQIFGVRSFRTLKQVDLIVTLKEWEKVRDVERVGLDTQRIKVLGVDLPHMVIPVRPGRDIARLVEVAAFYIKHRFFGGNPAEALEERLLRKMAESQNE